MPKKRKTEPPRTERHAMILRMPETLHQKLLRLVSTRIAGGTFASKNSVVCGLIENAEEKRS